HDLCSRFVGHDVPPLAQPCTIEGDKAPECAARSHQPKGAARENCIEIPHIALDERHIVDPEDRRQRARLRHCPGHTVEPNDLCARIEPPVEAWEKPVTASEVEECRWLGKPP